MYDVAMAYVRPPKETERALKVILSEPLNLPDCLTSTAWSTTCAP
jgi:hypothetical protein